MPMADAIRSGRSRTLTPRHEAVRAEACDPDRVANTATGLTHARFEGGAQSAVRGREPRARRDGSHPLITKAQHNRARCLSGQHIECGDCSKEAGGCGGVGVGHPARRISHVMSEQVILYVASTDIRESKAHTIRGCGNIDLHSRGWQNAWRGKLVPRAESLRRRSAGGH